MPQNLRPQTSKIAGNQIVAELYQKAKVPTEILQSEADFGV
jgi:hypothetical protein